MSSHKIEVARQALELFPRNKPADCTIKIALDYAEELEARLKSCASCKHNIIVETTDPTQCRKCHALGAGEYKLWELAERETDND